MPRSCNNRILPKWFVPATATVANLCHLRELAMFGPILSSYQAEVAGKRQVARCRAGMNESMCHRPPLLQKMTILVVSGRGCWKTELVKCTGLAISANVRIPVSHHDHLLASVGLGISCHHVKKRSSLLCLLRMIVLRGCVKHHETTVQAVDANTYFQGSVSYTLKKIHISSEV